LGSSNDSTPSPAKSEVPPKKTHQENKAAVKPPHTQKARPVRPSAPVKESRPEKLPVPDTKEQMTQARVRPREIDRRDLEELMAYRGILLTMTGGPAEITPVQQQYVALLEDRRLIVSRSHALHHEVSSVRSHLRLKGYTWRAEYHVDLEIIRQLYEQAEKIAPSQEGRVSDTVQMQREVMRLIQKAAEVRASDIHVVVHRYEAEIQLRVDSMITKQADLPAGTALELCQAAFAMSDVSDPTYMPMEQQGARITSTSLKGLQFPQGVQSIRLQFSPLPNGGRYMVARLLYEQKVGSDEDIDELGYAPMQIEQIRVMRRKPFGINVVSGPTGSGKSTTLQRNLVALMRERSGINVVTIEDPPEYIIAGAKQIPVSNAATADERREKFRQAITGALRLDPDIIMIGEIRDGVSAKLALEAAMTGHGVWTTLHTNDGISNLDRLRDMGVEIFNLTDASLMTGLVGQRLVRKTKQGNSVSFEEGVERGYLDQRTADILRSLAGSRADQIRFADTDKLTDLSKFSGRTVVAETILPDQAFLDLYRDGRKPEAIKYWLTHLRGMTMLEHAFAKMCLGLVDPREVQDKVGLIEMIDKDRVSTVLSYVS